MAIEPPSAAGQITRRAALGGAAAVAAWPALAEECRIGPPPRAKGPLVWMGMNQLELDDCDGNLTAFRQACWYSWPEQIESLRRLLAYSFEWAFAGHDGSGHWPAAEMRTRLATLIERTPLTAE
jgi:hypothetical protein